MYTSTKSSFGDFERIDVRNNIGSGFALVPSQGACLLDLRFGNIPVLDGYQTGEELAVAKWSKSRILLPFPNRLEDGTYHWQGKDYHFPIKEKERKVSVHGFKMHELPFTVKETQVGKDGASITLRYEHDATHPSYPFPFSVTGRYEMNEAEGFQISFWVKNEGMTAIPMGLGWHPYFKLDAPANELALRLPPCKQMVVNERMLPTGERLPYNAFAQSRKIGDTALDTGFTLDNDASSHTISLFGEHQSPTSYTTSFWLRSPAHQLEIWQETGPHRFNFFQVFTPDHRQSVAIEPMTCNINAFNNRKGLLILEPQASFSTRCGVRMS